MERLRDQGLTILLVEQNVSVALSIADRGYVLAGGRVVAEGTGRSLLEDSDIAGAYLGSGEPKSDVGARGRVIAINGA